MNRKEKKRKKAPASRPLARVWEKRKKNRFKKVQRKKTLLERAKNSNIQKQITLKCKKVIN